MAILANYTCKSFIKLTSEIRVFFPLHFVLLFSPLSRTKFTCGKEVEQSLNLQRVETFFPDKDNKIARGKLQ